jgi:hypothetical protein
MITLEQFKAAKKIVIKNQKYHPDKDIGKKTMNEIRNAMSDDPVHDLCDTWCNQEKWYRATESECTDTSWEDHNCGECMTCEIIFAMEEKL